ncbi:MAG: divergent polysaccharide deacetylase family protein [Pseudomonadota bacterium]
MASTSQSARQSTSAAAIQAGAAIAAGALICVALAFAAGARGDGAYGMTGEAGAEFIDTSTSSPRDDALAMLQARPSAPGVSAETAPAGRLAVIIDDIGFDGAALDRLLALDVPLTLSVLPYAADAPGAARRISAAGQEVFLHLPMEPSGLEDPGPYALTKDLGAEAMQARVLWALSRTPGARGVNNHMGSRLTTDSGAVQRALTPLAGEGLVFVDSLTAPRSVAARTAIGLGIEAAQRDVFLDHEREPAAIQARLDEALMLAAQHGRAIAIGHPYRETLQVLETLGARADAAGVELVFASDIVRAGESAGEGAITLIASP